MNQANCIIIQITIRKVGSASILLPIAQEIQQSISDISVNSPISS